MAEFDGSQNQSQPLAANSSAPRSTSQEIIALLRQLIDNIDALRAEIRPLTTKAAKPSEWVDADHFVASGLAKTRDAVFRRIRLGHMPPYNEATRNGCFVRHGSPQNPRYRFHAKNTAKFLEGSPSGPTKASGAPVPAPAVSQQKKP